MEADSKPKQFHDVFLDGVWYRIESKARLEVILNELKFTPEHREYLTSCWYGRGTQE